MTDDYPKNEEIMDKFKNISEFLKSIIKSKKDLLPIAGALYLAYDAIKQEIEEND